MTTEKQEIVWSVSEVNHAVREMIEGSLMPFYVKGEIGSLLLHRSGHVYLTLKDDKSQLRAAYFGGGAVCRNLNLANGDKVECFGKLTVYEVRGEYQFTIKSIRRAGLGDLQKRFDELKRKLAAEGLFDAGRKKPLPLLPRRIGVVTSASGAAIRDFLKLIQSRFSRVGVRIYPAQVQGAAAAREIAQGLEFFNRPGSGVDVIVVTRGGGSMEDLWAFNEEIVARAIAASKIPVISAVGHEIDFTIADFVADVRAATPSAAAELVVGREEELLQRLERGEKDMKQAVAARMQGAELRFEKVRSKLSVEELKHRIENSQLRLDDLSTRMEHTAVLRLERTKNRLSLSEARLAALDPSLNLKRGYVLLQDASSGEIIRSAAQPRGRRLTAVLADGRLGLTSEGPESASGPVAEQ